MSHCQRGYIDFHLRLGEILSKLSSLQIDYPESFSDILSEENCTLEDALKIVRKAEGIAYTATWSDDTDF